YPILNDGEVHVGISSMSVSEGIGALTTSITTSIIIVFAIGFLIITFFTKRITSPLQALVDATEKLGEGSFDTKLSIHSRDEVGQLTNAFNRMLENLQNTMVSKTKYEEQSKFLRALIESLPHPFYVIDVNTYCIVLANSATEKFGTWQNNQCFKLTHKRTSPCTEGDANEEHPCPLKEVLKTGRPAVTEHVHHDSEGRKFYYEVHGYPVLDDKGNIIQMIEYSIDITKRKEVEESLIIANKEAVLLNRQLEEKNREIIEQKEKLQLALDTISAMLEEVITEKTFNIRFLNPNLIRCYELTDCKKVNCPCHGRKPMRCWQVVGTYCKGSPSGTFASKIRDCKDCIVFKRATSDPIYEIGEIFNNMMHILDIKNRKLEEARN
ncbi:MAG: HAMP domain-containing protein, partial [Nitrospirae bacterium]|nr:HAMP domain-containing protein [Nitrospirota bacterium]